MRRTAIKVLAAILLLAAMTAAGAYVYLRRSLPVVNGAIQVSGISAPVDIVRDADDIPHIFGATKADALFGLGYAHAQDRLWQMEFQRRIGNGRLCEIFGDATLAEDRFLRTVGFGRAAQSAWERLPSDARAEVNAYVAGVNAFIATHHGSELPPEFSVLRFEPEPWTGEDVIVWVKMMAWDLSANYTFELLRHDLDARVGPARAGELLPPYPDNGLTIVRGTPTVVGRDFSPANSVPSGVTRNVAPDSWSAAFAAGLGHPDSLVRDFLLRSRTEALGSNNWVVDGTHTASGKPLLANDPHLATKMPSLWYLAHVTAGDFDVIGATLPGAPAVAIGRNRYIAWGETNVAADVEDLYREHLTADGQAAAFRGVDEPIRTIKETIKVKGAAPVDVDVRITRHGPLVSDAINANTAASKTEPKAPIREALAFRWTALDDDDTTVVAFLKLNDAKNWREFTDAMKAFVVPSQNFVYADTDGHIGYYAPGHIPIRQNGTGGAPADGWTGDAEWTGWIPFDELPHAYDPPAHFIVTANNRPMPASYGHFIALEYPNPYRAQRITDLLTERIASGRRLTPEDFHAIQGDTMSLHARELLPMLLTHVRPAAAIDKDAFDEVRRWNYDARGSSAAPAIFNAWFLHLARDIVGDELGEYALESYRGRFSFVTRFVENLLNGSGNAAWCDNVATPQHETCDDEVTAALHDGVASLAKQLGNSVSTWRWDAVHRAVFPHQGLDTVPVLHTLLSRSMPNGGDYSTVNVGPVDVDNLYQQISIPGYRQIVDLSPANDSRFIEAGGQSGHFLSPHYDDYLKDWQTVNYRRMRMTRAEAEKGAIGALRLMPRP